MNRLAFLFWLLVTTAILLLAPASPELRRPWMADAWRLVYLLCLAAQILVVARRAAPSLLYALERRMGIDVEDPPPWAPAEVVALLLLASSAAELPGPWLRPGLAASWYLALVNAIPTWTMIAAVQLYYLSKLTREVPPCPKIQSP